MFHGITTRAWGSLNPFVGYEGLQRLEAGIALSDGSPVLDYIVIFTFYTADWIPLLRYDPTTGE